MPTRTREQITADIDRLTAELDALADTGCDHGPVEVTTPDGKTVTVRGTAACRMLRSLDVHDETREPEPAPVH